MHDLGLEQLALSVGRKGLVENNVELKYDVSSGEIVSLGNKLFVLVSFLSLSTNGRLSVDDLDNYGEILRGLFDDQSGVTGSDQSSCEELVDFGLEDSVGNESSLLRNLSANHYGL